MSPPLQTNGDTREELLRPATLLARGGAAAEDPHGATAPPLYQTATFAQPDATRFGAYDYSRTDNPTRAGLEEQLAALDGGCGALAYSSGMAAIAGILDLAPRGVAAMIDLYGGTQRLLGTLEDERGLSVRRFDPADADSVEAALRAGVDLCWVETPSNPLLQVVDLRALSARCRAHGVLLVVDGTAMTPWLQRPLELGADVVVHSATKGIAGHGDTMAGTVTVRETGLLERLSKRRNAVGSALAPFDAWLVQRGLRTLGVRVERQCTSARRLAWRLASRRDIALVRHPDLTSHEGHGVHAAQASGGGCLVSFAPADPALAPAVVDATRRFTTAVSFGGVASSISMPTHMSHASVPEAQRRLAPLPEGLIRLSVGLEDVDDLWTDLSAALDGVRASELWERACRAR